MRKEIDQMRLTAGDAAAESDTLRGYHDYEQRFGDEIRGRRASMGKGLLDVQKDLGIRPWLIVAIEKADAKSFDSPWLIAPYVKSYARYLGLDADEAYARFQAECNSKAGGADGPARLTRLRAPNRATRSPLAVSENSDPLPDRIYSRASAPRSFRPSAKAVVSSAVVAGLCVGVAFLVWTVYNDVQTLRIAPSDDQYGNLEHSRSPDTTVHGLLPRRPEPEIPLDRIEGRSIAELNPDEVGVFPAAADATATEVAERSGLPADEPSIVAYERLALEEPLVEEPPKIMIVASGEVWIRVYKENTRLMQGTLQAGGEYVVPGDGGPYTLRTGLAANTYFRVGDRVFGPVKASGDVVDGIVLAPEDIAANYPAVELSTAREEVRLHVFLTGDDESAAE